MDEVVLGKRRDGKCTELKRVCRVTGDVFFCGRLRGRKWFRNWVRFGKRVRGSVYSNIRWEWIDFNMEGAPYLLSLEERNWSQGIH